MKGRLKIVAHVIGIGECLNEVGVMRARALVPVSYFTCSTCAAGRLVHTWLVGLINGRLKDIDGGCPGASPLLKLRAAAASSGNHKPAPIFGLRAESKAGREHVGLVSF